MSIKLKLNNPSLSNDERTYLNGDYTSGTSLTVKNNEGFNNANWFVVVGEPGQEQTESDYISAISGNTIITLATGLNFSHSSFTPVYLTRWDKISVERATSSGGSFTEITDSPFSIEWDDTTTVIVDDSGAPSNYYKWRFYNSQTETYSSYSDELPGTGLAQNSAGFAIKQIRNNPVTKKISDEIILEYLTDFNFMVYEQIPKAWWFTKEGSAVATVANTYKYAISSNWSDYLSMRYMLFNYITGDSVDNTYPLNFVPMVEFYNLKSDSNQASSDVVTTYTILPPDDSSAKGYIGLHPTPDTANCYLKPVYEYELSALDSFGDTLVIPSTKAYVDYVLYRVYDDIERDQANADKYNARVNQSIVGLRKRARQQWGQLEFMRFRGVRGKNNMFGSGGNVSSDYLKENYFHPYGH